MRLRIASGIVIAFLAVLGVAQTPWLDWESTPGVEGETLVEWPVASAMERPVESPLVLMFVHPKCACTKTRLRIFQQAALRRPEASWRIVAWRPKGSDWKPDTTLPIFWDEDGIETKRFGVTTSGHVFSFDASGAVQFSGGLTDLRGGSEEGEGARLLDASVHKGNRPKHARRKPVFGCSLVTST